MQKGFFFRALGLQRADRKSLSRISTRTGISIPKLKYYNDYNQLPSQDDLMAIKDSLDISPLELSLRMGRLDAGVLDAIRKHADGISTIIKQDIKSSESPTKDMPPIVHETALGRLHHGDCLDLMPHMDAESVDLIFADPPFNLNKLYPSGIDDDLKADEYIRWCLHWADGCIRLLKPGGSFFIWNLPKWNIEMAHYLNRRLTFRDWIAVDIKYSLPIPGRLYPSHYSLLYYCKGKKPRVFKPDRLPMAVCPHCMGDLKDYGGYKSKMNPKGVNMTDVWLDIPPVRHAKYKKRQNSNELSVRLMDRIIEMASEEGDLVFDPFGGAGTTYTVSEIKRRRWIGIEIGPTEGIVARIESLDAEEAYLEKIRADYNALFPEGVLNRRREIGLWTMDRMGNMER